MKAIGNRHEATVRTENMNQKFIGLALGAWVFAASFPADAQQSKKIPRIGYLTTRSGAGPGEKAFLQALQSLGYIEGQTIAKACPEQSRRVKIKK